MDAGTQTPRPGASAVPGARVASDGLPVVPSPAIVRSWPPASIPSAGRHPIWWAAVALLIAACAVGIGYEISQATGRTGFVVGAVLAVIPVPLLVWAIRWLDRHEPEPVRYLVLAFAWGAAVATLAAIFLNTWGADTFFLDGGEDAALEGAAVFVAPPVEEFFKGAIVVILAFVRRIDGVIDGIVTAAISAVGFAFTENILYYGRAFAVAEDELGGAGVLAAFFSFLLRGLVTPFAHPLFTMAIGIGVGLAVNQRSWAVRIMLPLAGYLVAVFMHGLWNALAVRGLAPLAIGYVAIMLPALAGAVTVAVLVRRNEGKVLPRRLPPYAEAGWIAPHEVAVLTSLDLRQLALDLADRDGGRSARRATDAYQRAVVRLGFLRERLGSGRRIQAGLEEEARLLLRLPTLRARAVVLPPPPPPWWRPVAPPPPYGFAALAPPGAPWRPPPGPG